MVQGLTDKESLAAIMKGPREMRRTLARMRELAEKGLREPHQLTPEETQELCGAVLRQIDEGKG